MAAIGLLLMAATGSVLFIADASHVAMNRVFQIKALLIAAGIINAVLVAKVLDAALEATPALTPLPARVRLAGLVSLAVWLSVAACGQLIAYF